MGKSKLSLQLAKMLNGEIISADAVQVYKGMDIGTDKLKVHERENIPHHLLDVVSHRAHFSAHDFWCHAMHATQVSVPLSLSHTHSLAQTTTRVHEYIPLTQLILTPFTSKSVLVSKFCLIFFCSFSSPLLQSILSRGKLPILVGGSGFYLNWYLHRREPMDLDTHDPALHKKIQKMIEAEADWEKRFV